MKTSKELIEWAVQIIDSDLHTLGRVERGVAIMTPDSIHAIISLNGPEHYVEDAKEKAINMIRTLREKGNLAGVVEIAEAWLSGDAGGGKKEREEVVIVEMFGMEGKTIAVWPLVRRDTTVRRGQARSDIVCGISWLDEAFVSKRGGTA